MTEVDMIRRMKVDWSLPVEELRRTSRIDWATGIAVPPLNPFSAERLPIANPRWLDLVGTRVACLMTIVQGNYVISACILYICQPEEHIGMISTRPLCEGCLRIAHNMSQVPIDGRGG